MRFPDISLAREIANNIKIPPRPEVLIAFSQETKKAEPKAAKIVNVLKADVSLCSAILQLVNSPVFGLRSKVTSIDHAFSLLGIGRVERVVTAVTMRNAISANLDLGRFWDSASEIAGLCSQLARQISGTSEDDAYTVGLFHDCGIPILMQQFADYKDTLREIAQTDVQPFTLTEDKKYRCNHAFIGFCLCEKWFLPDQIARAVLLHHEKFHTFQPEGERDEQTLSLLSILKMAEYISALHRQTLRMQDNLEWEHIKEDVLGFAHLEEQDFNDITAMLLEQLNEQNHKIN